jgi:hypothetical protein
VCGLGFVAGVTISGCVVAFDECSSCSWLRPAEPLRITSVVLKGRGLAAL